MKETNGIIGKFCVLKMHDGFMLDGFVEDMNDFGVLFRTKQKTSFIAWINIKELVPKEHK